jgi:hypothetical protein
MKHITFKEMKSRNNINNRSAFSLFVLALAFITVGMSSAVAVAQKDRVRMKLYYFKNENNERWLNIGLTAGSGRNMHGVKNGEVQLTSVLNDSTIVLTTVQTDTLGEIQLYLDAEYTFPMNEDGFAVIEATYEGNDQYRSASSDLEIADLEIEFEFNVEDSVKYLNVLAERIDKEGNKHPVEDLDVSIGIQRLYTVLPLDEITTDEDGIAELEVPDDLPGDAEGNLTFVARIDDSDEFGTVTSKTTYQWGVPVSYEIKPLPRQLFTDEAPLWMIASVCIILIGAWYHFFLSISKLIKLKKAANT